MRPMVKGALRRSWRDQECVQFGVDPEHAVVMDPVDGPAAAFLGLLDGTRGGETLMREAAALGMDPDRVRRLLAMLAQGGVLDDAAAHAELAALHRRGDVLDRLRPDLAALSVVHRPPGAAPARMRERGASRVRVAGAGRVGTALAAVLAAAGVGAVDVVDTGRVEPWDVGPAGFPAEQVGERRDAAARGVVRRAAGGRAGPQGEQRCRPWSPGGGGRPRATPCGGGDGGADEAPPGTAGVPGSTGSAGPSGSVGSVGSAGRAGDRSVTVIVPRDGLAAYVPDVAQARRLVASGVVHLYAGVLEGTGFVGPLVVPGRTACGECLALALADRDPALPRVLAQLRSGRQPAVPACDVALATAVAGIAAGHVLARLDGRVPPSAGARVELSQARLSTYVRALPPDPRCECGAAARQAAAAGAGASAAGARWECAGAGAGAGRRDGAGADKGDGGDAAAGPEEGSAGTRGGLRGGARAGGGTMAMEPTGNEGAHV